MELVNALRVKSCCGYGSKIVQEPRKGNDRRWKPVPDDWWRAADRQNQVRL
jgi:hypothetical protein